MLSPSPEDRRQAIGARLVELTKRHSQSEIARKTGTPVNKVNRYIHGTRIPCEFAAALVDALNVNPAWLLIGEGAPNVADVKPDTAQLAGNLLELIKAMSAAEHMQLGALTGKHHLRVLRDLSDAMMRYEKLREQLNKHSMPVLRNVLNELRRALDKRDSVRANELFRTAEQLRRICDDPGLAFDAAVMQGRLASLSSDHKRTLEASHRVATLALHHPHLMQERQLEALTETVFALRRVGHLAEARQLAESALAMASDELRQSDAAHRLAIEIVVVQISTGELLPGMNRLTALYRELQGSPKAIADAVMTQAMLFAGMLDVAEGCRFGEDSPRKAKTLIVMAMLGEQEAALTAALAYRDKVSPPPPECRRLGCVKGMRQSARGCERWWAEQVLYALRKETKDVLRAVRLLEDTKPDARDFALKGWVIIAAQVYRLLRREADARRCFRASCRAYQEVPPNFAADVLWQAMHQRNALELGNKREQQQAREFFRRHVDLGYGCFAHLI